MSPEDRIEALAVLCERCTNIMRGFALTLNTQQRDDLIDLAEGLDYDLRELTGAD